MASIIENWPATKSAIVVSAAAGTTDALLDVAIRAARRDTTYLGGVDSLRERQLTLIHSLLDESATPALVKELDEDITDILAILQASSLIGSESEVAAASVAGFGEVWSARLLAAYLRQRGLDAVWLDTRDVLVVKPGEVAPAVLWDKTQANLDSWFERTSPAPFVVITGFVASDEAGAPTTLGRDGSDYSASIFGSLLDAEEIVIWTDVDGVMSADPRLVPQAKVLEELSYAEAMELAYFGASVIHPAAMTPAIRRDIPMSIRNTFNPTHSGTRIRLASDLRSPVKGFAAIGGIALLNLEGTSMVGVPGISERLFGSLREAGVSVVMISQASSEHSICFAVPASQAARARTAVESTFSTMRHQGQLQELTVTPDCTIIAAVGDGMSGTPGIAANFFGSLARAGVNIKAIAQGSSERNISIVVDTSDATRAIRAAHAGAYLSRQTLSIGLIGPGHVGAVLLDQLSQRIEWLRDVLGIDLRIRAIAGSSSMILDESQIDLGDWRETLASDAALGTDLARLATFIHTESVPHAAIIDCSASAEIASQYRTWLGRGIHVITPNKKANSGSLDDYRELMDLTTQGSANYFYETTVGAALPIIQTLRDLVQTGDEIQKIEGVFSGTLSYLFNSFDGSQPFSRIVAGARDLGYTEPDPREDLSGLDVARKVIILAREMGIAAGLEDVDVESLIPAGLETGSVQDFLDSLGEHDATMADIVNEARSRGEVVRFTGVIDPNASLRVSLRSYEQDHPFARIRLTDNIVAFHTARYSENPLIVQGPGAGPDVTAGGVFADLLRLANYLGSSL